MVNRFGSRPIVVLGGLLCGLSMVTASFGSSIVYLYFCIGIIGGNVLQHFHHTSVFQCLHTFCLKDFSLVLKFDHLYLNLWIL